LSRPVTVGLIDYGMGNRRSVQKALEHVGGVVELTADHDRLASCERLVLPGVGAFPAAMERLHELELPALIASRVQAGVPLLGICLGMQLMFERSSELGGAEGLGLIPGEVTALDGGGLRIPHIGWSEVSFLRPCPLTAALPRGGCAFYHVHSFVCRPDRDEDVVAGAQYGERFATIVGRGNVYGVQFHPEKSSRDGLSLLRGFLAADPRSIEAGTATRAASPTGAETTATVTSASTA
jgi:imidazole glycerol-phosphate synthase subunit HisH